MLVEDERHAAGLAETAIGETDSVGLGELRWGGLVVKLVMIDLLLLKIKSRRRLSRELSRAPCLACRNNALCSCGGARQ